MPLLDIRTRVGTSAKDQGRLTVIYVNANRETMEARVIGQGTSSGLKIKLNNVSGSAGVIDNVPAATAIRGAGSTGAYRYRDRTSA